MSVLAVLLGGALGWLSGHVAALVPDGRLGSFSVALGARSAYRRMEHSLGAALGAVSIGLAYVYRSSRADFWGTTTFLLLLIAITLIDLRHHLVYPLMPIVGFLAGAMLNPVTGEASSNSSLVGAAGATGAFLALFLLGLLLFRVQALGFGDVLLAAMIGSMVGWRLMPATLFLGAVLSSVAGLVLLLVRRKDMRDYIPFGSGMCIAAMVVLILR